MMTLLQCYQCVIESANPVPVQIESLCIFINKPVPSLYENVCNHKTLSKILAGTEN